MFVLGVAVGGPVLVTARSVEVVVVAVAVAKLFAGFGSGDVAETEAKLRMGPVTPDPTVYVLVMTTLDPGAIVPKAQGYTVVQPPVFDTKVSPGGVPSVTDTPLAVLGPLL